MHHRIIALQKKIEPIRKSIIEHDLYAKMDHPDKLAVFMQHHVFAVWDFMSLLKSLQNKLTCVSVPWVPVGDAENRFLINEIVVGEESDVDESGNRMSHFELYLKAMHQCGADSNPIKNFISEFIATGDIELSFARTNVSEGIRSFVRFTFDVIKSGKSHVLASVFTFGREDLIPDMFMSMVRDLHQQWPEKISTFRYYLERHIEVDGDHHSHLAMKMVENLCGDNKQYWDDAEEFVLESLRQRKNLWDAALQSVEVSSKSKESLV